MPSSISVGATWSPRSTTNFANCLTLMMYFGSSESALIILVQRATCSGCSPVDKLWIIYITIIINNVQKQEHSYQKKLTFNWCDLTGLFFITTSKFTCIQYLLCKVCLSAARSHRAGGAKPVSDSLIPVSSLTRLRTFCMSSSTCFTALEYCPAPWNIHIIFRMTLSCRIRT